MTPTGLVVNEIYILLTVNLIVECELIVLFQIDVYGWIMLGWVMS